MRTEELPLTLDTRGVSKQLNLSRRGFLRLRKSGKFPPPLPGVRRPRWSTSVVLDWLKANGLFAGGPANTQVTNRRA
jgi:hypothetical protein